MLKAALCLSLACQNAAKAETVTYTLVNGDSLTGELITEESTDALKVLLHPQLGRLEISVDAIQPEQKQPPWKSTLSAGFNGNGTDGSSTFSGSLSAASRYKDDSQSLKLAGSFNYNRAHDKDKDPQIKTKKVPLQLRTNAFSMRV